MTIEELKQALEAATPREWAFDFEEGDSSVTIRAGNFEVADTWFCPEMVANARLMVEAVNNLPALLKVVEAAQVMLDAIDKGAVDSEEIVPVPGDGPPYRFHEEWAHRARKALEKLNND